MNGTSVTLTTTAGTLSATISSSNTATNFGNRKLCLINSGKCTQLAIGQEQLGRLSLLAEEWRAV